MKIESLAALGGLLSEPTARPIPSPIPRHGMTLGYTIEEAETTKAWSRWSFRQRRSPLADYYREQDAIRRDIATSAPKFY